MNHSVKNDRLNAVLFLLVLISAGFFVPSSIHPAVVLVKIVIFGVLVWRLVRIETAPERTERTGREHTESDPRPKVRLEPPVVEEMEKPGDDFGGFAETHVSVFRNLFAASSAALYVRDPAGKIILHTGEDDQGRLESVTVEDTGSIERVAKLKKTLIELELPSGSTLPGFDSRIVSFAGVPLLVRDQTIGVLALGSSEPGAFGPEDIPVLEKAGSILCRSMTLFHRSLHFEAVQTLFRIYLDMASLLKKARTEPEAADLLRQSLAQVFTFDSLTVCQRDASDGMVSHSWGAEDIRPGMRFALEDGLGGWIIKHGAALMIKDMAEGIRRPRFSRQESPKHAFRSFLGVPLDEGKPAAGCVCLESRSPAAYDDKSKEILWPMVEYWETISAGIRLKQLLSENKS